MPKLTEELDSPEDGRHVGSGWISGVLGLVLAIVGLGTVLCLRYPDLLTVAEARDVYPVWLIRLLLQLVLIGAFVSAIISIV